MLPVCVHWHCPMYMWCNIRRHPLTVLLPTRTSTGRCTNTMEWMGRETAWVTGGWECDEWNYSVIRVVRGVSIRLKERRVSERS